MNRILVALLALPVLTGCMSHPVAPSPVTSVAQAASLAISPRIVGAYRSQALISAYGKADIHHLELRLYTLSGETEVPVLWPNNTPMILDLTRAELESPLTIGNLRGATTYRVKAFAYKNEGTSPSDLISTTDSGSYRDVNTSNNDLTAVSLGVKLIDKSFAAATQITLSATGAIGFASVYVTLKDGSNQTVSTASLTPDQLPNVLRFDQLKANTTYTLAAQALSSTGEALSGASSQTTIPVETDTVVATSSLVLTVPY